MLVVVLLVMALLVIAFQCKSRIGLQTQSCTDGFRPKLGSWVVVYTAAVHTVSLAHRCLPAVCMVEGGSSAHTGVARQPQPV